MRVVQCDSHAHFSASIKDTIMIVTIRIASVYNNTHGHTSICSHVCLTVSDITYNAYIRSLTTTLGLALTGLVPHICD